MSLVLDVFAAKGATLVCFPAGTKVHTRWGLADIEKLEPGVPVLTYYEETGETEYKKIKKVSHRMTQRMCALELSDGTSLEVTPEHRFYCNGKWVPIEELNVNNSLQLKDNSIVVIEKKTIFPIFVQVYNIEIEDNENYYVTEDGILVHNGYKANEDISESKTSLTLKGEKIDLPNIKEAELDHVKRSSSETADLRKAFNSTERKAFLKKLGEDEKMLKSKRFSGIDISRIKDGKVPTGYQVHHKYPLDDSGTNDFDNLVLIKNEPYHKATTNYQNSITRGMNPGDIKKLSGIQWMVIFILKKLIDEKNN